ncbi:uncharacterized protein ARMOST_15891 [Armillaria ostoyae]|uniref:Protein kinase domain-containing protein n=1 Tax=Armillaria ostoyae TaxID=47428 RepID=A0A284RUK9_ARMOS|nr:uncharacterized protein ARMOST_15891 [Armillaria ostoyae]
MGFYDTELAAYQLFHLHLITNAVQELVLEYIPGVSMDKLKPGIDISEYEAERISSDVMPGLRSIETENLLHNDIHTRNVVLREGDRSPVIIDFGDSDEDWRTEVQICITRGGIWWILLSDAGRGQ